jgi:hypothetical protein
MVTDSVLWLEKIVGREYSVVTEKEERAIMW